MNSGLSIMVTFIPCCLCQSKSILAEYLFLIPVESESWQEVRTATVGPSRHRHAAALYDARLYVHAGQCDLRDCSDLWHYDTSESSPVPLHMLSAAPFLVSHVLRVFVPVSRVWTQVRTPAKTSPSARSGHAGLRAGAHFYIFGGEAHGHPTNELWRFHFGLYTNYFNRDRSSLITFSYLQYNLFLLHDASNFFFLFFIMEWMNEWKSPCYF